MAAGGTGGCTRGWMTPSGLGRRTRTRGAEGCLTISSTGRTGHPPGNTGSRPRCGQAAHCFLPAPDRGHTAQLERERAPAPSTSQNRSICGTRALMSLTDTFARARWAPRSALLAMSCLFRAGLTGRLLVNHSPYWSLTFDAPIFVKRLTDRSTCLEPGDVCAAAASGRACTPSQSAGHRVSGQLGGEQPTRVPAMAARYACMVPNGKPELPVDIELYLAQLSASAKHWGHAVDLAAADAGAGVQYLDRAAARAAARLKMKVEERTGDAPGTAEQVRARLIAAFPKARVAPSGDRLIEEGMTGFSARTGYEEITFPANRTDRIDLIQLPDISDRSILPGFKE